MTEAGFSIRPGDHPIVPIMLGDARLAHQMAADLLREGIYVVGFSYPVVPKDAARIRVQISAAHEPAHLEQAVARLHARRTRPESDLERDPSMAKRLILHATDFSSASRPAFAKAVEMTKNVRGQLLLLHVLNPMLPMMSTQPIEPPTYAQLVQASRAWALRQLARAVTRAKEAGVRATSLLVEGPEAGTIARVARSRRAAMIVIGTHGRSGVERVLLGSVASRVVSLAPCPVMTVRGR